MGWRHRRRGITHLVPKHLLTHFLFEKEKGTIGPGECQKSSTAGKVKSFLQHSSDQTEGTQAWGREKGQPLCHRPCPPHSFPPLKLFLQSGHPIQQVKMTLESLQNQSKKNYCKISEETKFRWSPGQLAWMVATRTWTSRSPAQLQGRMCTFPSENI